MISNNSNFTSNPLVSQFHPSLSSYQRYDQKSSASSSKEKAQRIPKKRSKMSELDQNDHPLWMNPMENMYSENHSQNQRHSQARTHNPHEQMEHNQNQAHVDASHQRHHDVNMQAQSNLSGNIDNTAGNVNTPHNYYSMHGTMEHAQQDHNQVQAQPPQIPESGLEINTNQQGYSNISRDQDLNRNDNVDPKMISKGEKQIERAERKRKRERQRREDVNRLFEDLNSILARIEKEQHELLEQQEQEHQDQDDDKMKKKLKWIRRNQIQLGKNSSTSSLNRAEVIARAVAVLEELSEERRDQRVEIESLKQELSSMSKVNQPQSSSTQGQLQLHLPDHPTHAGMNQPHNAAVEAVMNSLAVPHQQASNPSTTSTNTQPKPDQQVVMMVPMMVPAPHAQNSNTGNATPRAVFFPHFPNAASMQPQAQIQAMPSWNNPAAPNSASVAYTVPQTIQHNTQTYAPAPQAGMSGQIQQMSNQTPQAQQQDQRSGQESQRPQMQQQQQQQQQQPQQQQTQQPQTQNLQGQMQPNHNEKNRTSLNVPNIDGKCAKNNNVNANEGNLAHCANDEQDEEEKVIAV